MSFVISKKEQENIEELVKDQELTIGKATIDYIKVAQWYIKKYYEKEATCLETKDYTRVASILDRVYDMENKK